jgi:hypothetical protein
MRIYNVNNNQNQMKHSYFTGIFVITIILSLRIGTLRAQFVQNQFMIAAATPPTLTLESATFAPGKFTGHAWMDLGERINTGPKAGKFEIDY